VAGAITADDDSSAPVNGASGANGVVDVIPGDTLAGAQAALGDLDLGIVTPATAIGGAPAPALDIATGLVDVPAGTPAGTYGIVYRICEKLNPGNCATATATVTVVAAPIAATDDTVDGIAGISGGANVLNVLTGDRLNGAPATAATVDIALAPGAALPAGLGFDTATGNVSAHPNTPAGTHSFDYRICEKLNPDNCATATATLSITAGPIVATGDSADGIGGAAGGANVLNLLAGDTLDGVPATAAKVDIGLAPGASVPAGLIFDPATGNVSVTPGTPAGRYSFDYRICEKLNPDNCAIAAATLSVTAGPIVATGDSADGIGGSTGAADVLNVLMGDTLDGAAATTATVDIALAPGATLPVGLAFDPATGDVSVLPGTPAGAYGFDYRICEKLNPDNCATATATLTVAPAVIAAANDAVDGVNGGSGGNDVVNAFAGDMIDGQPATPANATVAPAPGATLPAGLTFDPATGNVSVAPGTPDGIYSFAYMLCERLNPDNCTTATISVTVLPPRSTLNGIVYFDDNMNRTRDADERPLGGWVVELVRGGQVVRTARTDAQGYYSLSDLLSGGGYAILFRHPTTHVPYGRIDDAELPVNGLLADQNLPVDPSGVIYDAVTRQPIAGALVRLASASGAALPGACFVDSAQASQTTAADGAYRFDIVAGAASACPAGRTEYRLQVTAPAGYADPGSTVIAAEDGAFDAAGRGSPAAIVAKASAPREGDPTTYYLAFRIAQGDDNVVNNHIPLDPFLTRTPLLVTKTGDKRTASTGDLVSWTITVRNTESAPRGGVSVVDMLPPGLRYVAGSARRDGAPAEPVASGRELRWDGQTLSGNSTQVYRIVTVIGAGVTQGDRVNTALGRSGRSGIDISNRAQAVVSIVASALFDCAEVIGKVFDDRNGNGYQDEGEPGMAAARVATVNGELVTADEYGRYHITCAAVPDAQIGSNFVLKLDPRSVPEGYAPTADNPQSIRLTRGKIGELNFGVQKARSVDIAVDARAFRDGTADLLPDFASRIDALPTTMEAQRLAIRIAYAASEGEAGDLSEARLIAVSDRVRAAFQTEWSGPQPMIEADMTRAQRQEQRP
jgi:uncharacterized repeat protein (TIGR01451 family)